MECFTQKSQRLEMAERRELYVTPRSVTPYKSQPVLTSDLSHIFEDFLDMGKLDEFLIDSEGALWFTEKVDPENYVSKIHIFSEQGTLIETQIVTGKATLYEYDYAMIATCEGPEDSSSIHRFCKNSYSHIDEWGVDGFLWDIEAGDGNLYAVSYQSDSNEAKLHILTSNEQKDVVLGKGFFPTGILQHNERFYVSAYELMEPEKGMVLTVDKNGELIEQTPICFSPRQIFKYGDQLVLHGIDLQTGKADRLLYVDSQTKQMELFKIPKTNDIRVQERYLLLYNKELQSMYYWSHARKKVNRIVHWPYLKTYGHRDAKVNH